MKRLSLEGGCGWIVFALVSVLFASLGDIFHSKAMHTVGVKVTDVPSAFRFAGAVAANPRVWLAMTFLITHFAMWMVVLQKLELSVAVPLTASNYLYNAVLVGPMLGETVTARRWLGICIIVVGVVLVTRSESMKEKEP